MIVVGKKFILRVCLSKKYYGTKKKKKSIEQYNFCKGYLKSNLILIPQKNFFFFPFCPILIVR